MPAGIHQARWMYMPPGLPSGWAPSWSNRESKERPWNRCSWT